jgi:hypothetical protein
MISEIARVLKVGGQLVMTFPFLYAECDFRDYQRWTMEGMRALLQRHGLDTELAERRGGPLFAAACGAVWAIQHAIPGQRRSWRSARTSWAFLRSALVALLTLPFVFLSWVALALDGLIPSTGAYMGGAILARRAR